MEITDSKIKWLAWLPVCVWVITPFAMAVSYAAPKSIRDIFNLIFPYNLSHQASESISLNLLAFTYFLSLHLLSCNKAITSGRYGLLVSVSTAFSVWLLLHLLLTHIFHANVSISP